MYLEWPTHYAALLEYFKEHSTCNVPQSHTYKCELPGMGEEGGDYNYIGRLGVWLHNQRSAKKGTADKITPDRLAQQQLLVDPLAPHSDQV